MKAPIPITMNTNATISIGVIGFTFLLCSLPFADTHKRLALDACQFEDDILAHVAGLANLPSRYSSRYLA